MSQFFTYDDVTFNRNYIQAVSGISYTSEQPDDTEDPFFRVVLTGGEEWQFSASTPEALLAKREQFLRILLG